jgi:tetratricopeptide (TPR) repeat protein
LKKRKKKDPVIDLDAFRQEAMRLHALIDTDPAKAIEEARAIPYDVPIKGVLYTGMKAGTLVDGGACIKDKSAIEEGVALFRKLLKNNPDKPEIHYNLGNGLIALADQQPFKGNTWYLDTAAIRREARGHLQTAISSPDSADVLSTAFTNLGNTLSAAHRWVEAYDAYSSALLHDRSNAVASTGAAKILLRCVQRRMGDKRILRSIAARHLRSANLHAERLAELAGMRAQTQLADLLKTDLADSSPPNLKNATNYEKFVAKHRLALSLTIDGMDCSLKRWDSLRINSLTESIEASSGVPPLFAMLNVMKSDFLAARHLTYHALTAQLPESGLYADTLDYAVYGVAPSLLALSQRACIDVLDKIAAGTTEYFRVPGNVKVVYFWSRWFDDPQRGKPLAWHPSLRRHIDSGNTAIIALADVAHDLNEDGFLTQKKAFRHSSTHRFTVLHDIGCEPSRACAQIEHSGIEEFKQHLIESLQLARAAILYFVEMIAITEASRTAGKGMRVAIDVPNHHHIRGDG